MRRKIAAICVGLMVALVPGAALADEEVPPPVEVKRCPAGYEGVTVTHYDPYTGYTEIWACKAI